MACLFSASLGRKKWWLGFYNPEAQSIPTKYYLRSKHHVKRKMRSPLMGGELAEGGQETVYLFGGVVMDEADAEEAAALFDA